MSNAKMNHTINPFTLEQIDSFSFHNKDELTKILSKSHQTFQTWSNLTIEKRKFHISNFLSELKKSKKSLSSLMSSEMGKPIKQSIGEIDRCISIIEFSLENVNNFLKDEVKDFSKGKAIVSYRPQGVILGIQPWNFPLYQVLRYTIPNLLAGNTVLLKHAKNVWGTALMIEKIFSNAKLPEGAFTVLRAKSEDLDFMYESKKIRGITFTGSSETGSKIAEQAAKNLKKTLLELGGSDAYIVLKDADLDSAIQSCVLGRVNNNGQTCINAKRFLVEDSVYDKFKEKFVTQMKSIKIGDPQEEQTQLGPMARVDLLEKLHGQVKDSIDKGANCLIGGKPLDRKGYFYPPTVLENLSPGMPAYNDELFGPVASLIRVKDLDEAIEISNSSSYGLGGGIFGADQNQLIQIAKNKLDTGMVNINGYGSAEANIPFGGVKDSGYGREFSHHGFHEFVNIKSIMIHE